MVDNETDDDSFLQKFMERAKKREVLLSQIGQVGSSVVSNIVDRNDVTYPPLSPLPEERADDDQGADDFSIDQRNEESNTDDKEENVSPSDSELNYSSDLSLECETNEVYRAEPVLCHSSPDHPPLLPQHRHQASPRKQIPQATVASAPLQPQFLHVEQPAAAIPLQERQPEQKASSSQSLPGLTSAAQSLKDLQLRVERAAQTRTQLKKVVEISKYGSKEHVEAARLLQIAELEHLNYTNYVAKYKQGIRKRTESLGSIMISGIRLKISSRLRDELADDGVSHFFFCVASYEAEVKATGILNTNDIRRQDLKAHLHFRDKIAFVDLPPDFKVKIEVFELVISQPLPKILSMLTPSKKSRITPSNFKRVGSLILTLDDREICYKNFTQFSQHEESKYIERECKFLMELKPEQLPCKAGMLHVRCLNSEGLPDWSRFWVDSSSAEIRFWKSRQDALDGKKPNQTLDFKELCSESVQKLTPDDDLYRQNSFVLYSYQQVAGGEKDTLLQRVSKMDNKYKLVKHQMAADNKEDRDSWCAILDRSMHCFREWHGKTKIFPIESAKEIFSSQ